MPFTNSSSLSMVCASFIAASLHLLKIAPCLMHTPPSTALLVHPSCLHGFIFAPCLTQTPPLITLLEHPSWLQILTLTFAPCLTQTPPIPVLEKLVQPSWLHFLLYLFAPCIVQTFASTALLVWYIHHDCICRILCFVMYTMNTPSLFHDLSFRPNCLCLHYFFCGLVLTQTRRFTN